MKIEYASKQKKPSIYIACMLNAMLLADRYNAIDMVEDMIRLHLHNESD
jgi:hypothetical protein